MHHTSLLITITPNSDHQKQVLDYLQSTRSLPITPYSLPNLHWINTEKESLKIKTVREILSQISYSSYGNETQFYALLHADLATIPAQNALLKLVEEPPSNTVIILTATNPNKILPTIQSRCQTILLKTKKENNEDSKKLEPFLNFFSNPNKTSYSKLISLVEPYKDRKTALKLTNSLMVTITQTKIHLKNPSIAQNLLKTHQLLEKNINVKLALENYLFNIKSNQQK